MLDFNSDNDGAEATVLRTGRQSLSFFGARFESVELNQSRSRHDCYLPIDVGLRKRENSMSSLTTAVIGDPIWNFLASILNSYGS